MPFRIFAAAVALLLAGCARAPRPPRLVPQPRIEPYDQPAEAAAYYAAKRAPEGSGIPVERYFAALERMRRMPVYSSATRRFAVPSKSGAQRDLSLGSWQELGPGNIGGRTRAMVIHPSEPDIMYAGGVAGGVWKTTNGGASWTQLDDLLPNLAVSTLAMDPKNPEVLYAGTGEGYNNVDAVRGAGILKTTDAGQTWKHLDATRTPSFYYVNKVAVSPVDSNRIYAATGDGVWRSLDAGDTWTRVLARDAVNSGCLDLVIRADQPTDYLFTSCGKFAVQASIFRNTDASGEGQWREVFTEANMSRTSLALAPSNQSVIYALAATYEAGDRRHGLLGVFRSTANGDPDSWEARTRNTSDNRLNTALLSNARLLFADVCSGGTRAFLNQGWYDNVIAVDPLDPERVWAGGIDLFRSDDGGATWGLASYWWTTGPQGAHADHHAIVFHPRYDGEGNQRVYTANDGGIYRTTNARAEAGAGERAPCSASSSRITWEPLNNNYGVTQFYHGTAYPGGQVYFGGTQDNGTVLGADAAGRGEWLEALGGDGGYVAVDPSDANLIYMETTELSLRKSADGGNTLRRVTSGITEPSSNFAFITPFTLDPNESRRLWIGGRSLWRSEDRAESWSAASQPLEEGKVSALAVARGDSNRVLGGTDRGYIHRSSEALAATENTAWPATRPRTGFVSSLTFDPTNPDVAYATYSTFNSAGQTGHVFRSTDAGATWSSVDGEGDSGIPDIPVHSLVVDPDNPQTLYVGTDLGVFVSLDGGASWMREDTGFPNTVVEALALDRSGGGSTLFAFTHGRGAWRVRLGGAPACVYKVTDGTATIDAAGGLVNVGSIETADNCTWSTIAIASWLVPEPANRTGSGPLTVRASVNSTTRPRTGAVLVADRRIQVTQPAPAFAGNNDEPERATAIARLPYAAIQDTRTATSSASDPRHSCTETGDSRTVWFRFTAPAAGTAVATATLTRYDNGRNAGVVLTAYPFSAARGDELACAKDSGGLAELRFAVAAGESYLVQVSGEGSANPGGFLVFALNRVD